MGLVLTRNVGKSIFIDGGKIKITVIRVRGMHVSLDIVAPKEMTVDREEIYERKLNEGCKDKNKETDGNRV